MRLTFAPLRGHELPVDMVMLVVDTLSYRFEKATPRWRFIINHKGTSVASGVAESLSGAQRDMAVAIADIATRPETYAQQHDLTLCAEPLCVHSAASYLRLKETETVRGFCREHHARKGAFGPDDAADNYEDVTAEAIQFLAAAATSTAPGGGDAVGAVT